MPFGKHRGERLSDIPFSYLAWVLDNVESLNHYLRTAIENELASRTAKTAPPKPPPPPRHDGSLVPRSRVQEVLTSWWREVCLRWHPDRGGNLQAMQALTAAHDRLRQMLEVLS